MVHWKRTVDPVAEPVLLEELRDHIRHEDTEVDLAYLHAVINAARTAVEEQLGRALITQTWRLTLDRFPCVVRLPRPPLQSVTSIQYVDTDGATQVLSSALYRVDTNSEPARIEPAYGESWPSTRGVIGAVTVTFVAGYGDVGAAVPELIRHWIKVLAGTMYEHREEVITGTIAIPVGFVPDAALGAYKFIWHP